MASKKKGNSQQARARKIAQARAAAEAQRRRQVRTRRMSIAGAVAVVAAVGVVAIVLISGGGSGKTDVASTSSTSTPSTSEAPLPSAAGKPCVAVADPLPPGAPAVPVKVGPPPAALVTEDLKPGTGAVVTAGQSLTVNYIGASCSTGKIFDSSYKGGKPIPLSLSGVIPGWQKGIPGMKVGGQRLLGIPPDDGYGDSGSGGDIAPGETLWFVVEVLDAKAPAAPAGGAPPAPAP